MSSIRFELFLITLVLAVVPAGGTYLVMNDVVETSMGLAFNQDVHTILDDAQGSLKELKELNPKRVAQYRERFDRVQDLKQVFRGEAGLRSSLSQALKTYFGIGMILALAVAVVIALVFSRRVERRYRRLFAQFEQESKRAKDLEEISAWQDVARRLAHEIRNPLTPIELATTELKEAHPRESAMILDEVENLKRLTSHFSEFARLPSPKLEEVELKTWAQAWVKNHGKSFQGVGLEVDGAPTHVNMDPQLMGQVLLNLVKNAHEANPSGTRVRLELRHQGLRVSNTGVSLKGPFKPHHTTKGPEHMGLGLTISRKIMLDHGGDLRILPSTQGACVELSL